MPIIDRSNRLKRQDDFLSVPKIISNLRLAAQNALPDAKTLQDNAIALVGKHPITRQIIPASFATDYKATIRMPAGTGTANLVTSLNEAFECELTEQNIIPDTQKNGDTIFTVPLGDLLSRSSAARRGRS